MVNVASALQLHDSVAEREGFGVVGDEKYGQCGVLSGELLYGLDNLALGEKPGIDTGHRE